VDCDLLQAIQLDVIFNFARYEELKEAVQQLLRDNLDPDLMREEAHDLFESWWSSNNSQGEWNEAVKERTWTSLWNEFGSKDV
jgi:hypothetical protein